MKTYQEFCEPRTKEIGAPVEFVSPTMTKWANEYAKHVAQPLLDEIATKDLRIKKLEYAAKAVIRRGLIHNYMCDDEFEAVIVDLQDVVEGVSGE